MAEQLKRINVLEFDRETLGLFSLARHMGFVQAQTSINSLVEGAQTVLSFGKETVSGSYPDGLWFELTPDDEKELARIMALDQLVSTYRKMKETGGITQKNLELLWAGTLFST